MGDATDRIKPRSMQRMPHLTSGKSSIVRAGSIPVSLLLSNLVAIFS